VNNHNNYSYDANSRLIVLIYEQYRRDYPHKFVTRWIDGVAYDVVDYSSGKTHPVFPRDEFGNYKPEAN
jgi:hypothetical protein